MILLLLILLVATLASAQDELQCHIPGECTNDFPFGFTNERSYSDCQLACRNHVGTECSWFTYYGEFPDSDNCYLHLFCRLSNDSCTNCFSGQVECPPELELSKLLVIGGRSAENKVEVIDLADPGKTCPALNDFPGSSEGAEGTFIDGQAMACGGFFNLSRDCYTYDAANDAWTATTPMVHERSWADAIQLSPTEWWMTAGYNGSGDWASTEIFTVGQGFSLYVDLPDIKEDHNVVRINATHYLLLGAHPSVPTNRVWIFDRSTEQWTEVARMNEPRDRTHAGLVRYPDGHEAVVVAGGGASTTMEVYDLRGGDAWMALPDLPSPGSLYGGVSVQYGDSVLVVGGYVDEQPQTAIYRFDTRSQGWVEMPQKLRDGRVYFAAFLVPEDFIECV